MNEGITHFVGGRALPGNSGRFSDVFNPATGEISGHCPLATAREVDEAVEVASTAAVSWARASHAQRTKVIFRFRELLVRETEQLGKLISEQHGKTSSDAIGEVQRGIDAVEFATNAPHLTKGEFAINIGGGIDNFSLRQPLGVVCCIAPFNFPVMVPLMMSSMAVACGNAVVMKPSEKTPSSTLYLARLWQEAGLPDGVWNIMNGDKEAVDALLAHPGVKAVSFVGSTGVGEYVYKKATSYNKRAAVFTGGKNHMVIMPDADLDEVVDSFISAGYGSAGQRCMAISVAMPVTESVGDALVERLIPRVQSLKAGPFFDPSADFGPIVTKESRNTIERYIEEGCKGGAEVLVDGRDYQVPGYENGFFIGPTLLDRIDPESSYYKAEVFGPARAVLRARTVDDAIRLVNKHEYGNGVAIFTKDGGVAKKFYENVEVGMIGINVPIPVPGGFFNFGGLKRSSFGEAKMFGPDAARFYTKEKTICSRWAAGITTDLFKGVSNNSR